MSRRFLRIRHAWLLGLWACWTPALAADAPRPVSVHSPDGKNQITLQISEASAGQVTLSVERAGKPILLPGAVEVRLHDGRTLARHVRIQKVDEAKIDQSFELLWGKTRTVRDHGSWARIQLVSDDGMFWHIELRASDDGVAFRYVLPAQSGLSDVEIEDEVTEYRLATKSRVLFTTCKDFKTDHETEYLRRPLDELPTQVLIDLPMLVTWSDGTAAALTEARVRDFSNMYVQRAADESGVVLRSRLSPRKSPAGVCVVGRCPLESPWRVILLGDSAGKLLESNLLLCLNDERPPRNFDWARPGKTTWHWWNTVFEEGLPFAVGMNFETHKYYIDFCARHGIQYHAIVADDRPWYVQSKKTFAPGPDTDIVTPRAELQLPRLLEYAKQHRVGIRLWVHWKPLDARLDETFATYESWGIRGLMVDFLDRDDQEIVNYCERVLEAAERHKLHIQFHGSYKPSGEQRTFPHLFNREGVLNLEYLKWSARCTPDHDLAVAYTRLLAGPLDYHLGGFRGASRAQFRFDELRRPFVFGTRCHQLAMYVVYENPMPMVCDVPSAYEGQPGFEFLARVPTTWDETRFVVGDAGEYVVLAQRSGTDWYLGGMTNWTPRKLEIPLAFLDSKTYRATIYRDGSLDEERPNELCHEERAITAKDFLPAAMAPGGGMVAALKPK